VLPVIEFKLTCCNISSTILDGCAVSIIVLDDNKVDSTLCKVTLSLPGSQEDELEGDIGWRSYGDGARVL
jgi:hypothetical protein